MGTPSLVPRDIAPGSVGAWLLAIRPKTLPAAVAPVLLGSAIAWWHGPLKLGPGACALLGALLLQIASNLANDVFDYEKGKDTSARLGPIRVVQAGLLAAASVRRALAFVLAGCVAVGCYLLAKTGWPIAIVGLAAMVSALAYTAGPYPLGYHGLGDLFVFLFFGPVAVAGTTYVHSSRLSGDALTAGVAAGALAVNILIVNNLRDRAEDASTGKRTLVVRFGKHFAMYQAIANAVVAYSVSLFFYFRLGSNVAALLPLLSAPLVFRWYRKLGSTEGRALNHLLAEAGQLLLLYAVLLSLGLIIAS